MKWKCVEAKSVLKTIPFEVEELILQKGCHKIKTPYHRLKSPDWVNVLPITESGEAILIRQFRAGSLELCLETPGGCMDPGDGDPEIAAKRELEEETGYFSNDWEFLGSQNPNAATHQNHIHLI